MAHSETKDTEISILAIGFLILTIGIIVRLFVLQILDYNYYSTLALSTHEIYQKLYPERGQIYFQDTRDNTIYPAAVNKEFYLIYAIPKEISVENTSSTVEQLAVILNLPPEDKIILSQKLSRHESTYAVVAKKQSDAVKEQIKAAKLTGIYYIGQQMRFYPENDLAGNVLGFTSFDDKGGLKGNYGLEGYWDKTLSGRGGFLEGELGAKGGWITLGKRTIIDAVNGADLILSIDRSLEFEACSRLKKGLEEYGAKSASLIMMNAKTGAILAMCSLPDFDPNNYSKVKDDNAYNNSTIFTSYEPGSVFKPITMSMALDMGLVSPDTAFTDPCSRKINGYEINNALDKCYGQTTMTGVLENSINTGMIAVVEKLGKDNFKKYTQKFGLGEKIGIDTYTESKGNMSQLDSKNRSDVGYATASFGQGITVTPLQLAVAYAALANGGQMPKPYLVSEIRYDDGRVEKTTPEIVGNIISARSSKLITGMLISVVEKTYWRTVKIPEYYIAGKTGTAQIPGPGGYTDSTNHTFSGYFPAGNPQFVMIVKYEAPQRQWAEGTAGPVFKDVADFTLKYYGIKAER